MGEHVSRVGRFAAVAAAGLPLLLTASPAAAASLPPARVDTMQPRVVTLEPRVVDVTPKKRERTFTVDTDVLFGFDSAKLSPGAADVLDSVVTTLNEREGSTVTVVGHTDSVGSAGYNQDLSERRAKAVRRYLEEHVRAAADHRYKSAGRGEKDPVAANRKPDGSDNPTGRRKNRRVTITYT